MENTQWTYEKIKSAINEIVETTGQDHMPTHSEMISFYGDNKLANAVRRHGGTEYWALELGFPCKSCESKTGRRYENLFVQQLFEKTGIESELTQIRYPYDVLASGSVKVDVKSGFKVGYESKYFSFNLEKKDPTCDVFVVYCLSDDEKIEKTYIIPACVMTGKKQLSLGVGKSKYDKFIDRWDIIEKMVSFFDEIKQ